MYEIYNIKMGDTLENLAKKLGITPEVLATINGLDVTATLTPNTNIIIPSNNSFFNKYIIKKGDTLYEIARLHNISANDLAKLNGLEEDEYIYPGEEIIVPKQGTLFYITEENDTLNKVANALNTTPNNIANQNGTIYLIEDQLIVYKK